jgi:selenocysteine lyase/cysteine desulfurase
VDLGAALRIDRSTAIVAVPHCHWTDGGLIDLEAVAAACRRVGAALCVDATQSVGALPLDVRRIDPDFVAVASLELLSEWTVPRVLETLRLRTCAIAERARSEFGISSVPADRRAGHYLGLRFSGGIPSDLPKRLAAAQVYVSVRGQAMRVTPHLWNTDEDVEKLFAVLKSALA